MYTIKTMNAISPAGPAKLPANQFEINNEADDAQGILVRSGVNVLLCGGIGGGAQMALAQAGIRLYGGITGNADSAAAAYLAGTLVFDPNARCTHHDHEESHSCGAHACHADKGGCTGSCH